MADAVLGEGIEYGWVDLDLAVEQWVEVIGTSMYYSKLPQLSSKQGKRYGAPSVLATLLFSTNE